MQHRLLISGQRSSFTTLSFHDESKQLNILAEYEAPSNASWVEPWSCKDNLTKSIGLSEGEDTGLLYTFEIDHEKQKCRITGQQPTRGAPAHFITLHDQSALALATYLGGTIALYPITCNDDEIVLREAPRTEVFPAFPYKSVEHGPDKARQRQCHVHQILEDRRGMLYAPDLGSDRVWVLRRNGLEAHVFGWLQCPPGHGPRHAVLTPDERIMYVIGELSHVVVAFDLSTFNGSTIEPIEGFAPSVMPPSVDSKHQAIMDSAEICFHPRNSHVLYVSNRWERHIVYEEGCEREPPPGDSIAIILLSSDRRQVEEVKHIGTGLDVVRGMRFSPDGKYICTVGQEGGGVEIYEVKGSRGEAWSLVAKFNDALEGGIKHVVWL